MEETTRNKVLEIIRQAIDEVVYDEMKQMPARLQAKQEERNRTKAQLAQDAHDALFGKSEEEWNYRLQLHENEEKPKVTKDELIQFEKEFKGHFPGISFDKQNKPGQNGQIVDFPIINGQKDAVTSGKIVVGKESIGFSMSLVNGFKIKSLIENGNAREFEIKKETKDVFGKILNLYEESFKKRFNDIINPAEETGEEAGIPAATSGAPTPEMPAAPTETPPVPAPAV